MLFSLLAVGLASERTQTAETYWSMWQDFKASGIRWEHLPEIFTAEEHGNRFNIFMDNVDKINRHNAEGHSYTMGITPFADMTAEEFKQKVVGQECKHDFDKKAKKNEAIEKLRTGRRRAVGGNPDKVNWVTAGKVTAVKNQGSCGSCWSFSTTGSIEGRTAIANNASPVSLSEQELVDCDKSDHACNGGSMDLGMEYAASNKGLCLESEYSYHAVAGTCVESSCTHHSPISSHTDVAFGEDALETAVAAGPVSIAIEADQSAFQLYTGGVLDSSSCGAGLDHGVLAVGYDNTASDKYWIVKNSWGSSWGENGYIRFCKDCNKNCLFGSFHCKGQCGIAAAAVFPVV